ncbi:Flp pilus assembly protein CpaB [Phycicoccus flavus]|uniref:Flp pilus assembly protein CpaB n=1 Tax=Phycicoccus flavus TaxID=2502783 RepID=UPI000FEB8A44|nr:RcpC/CpaB family pilus assembly protein [Phycicoccus flavus]NHA69170.1 Flp pilus assembly protein CpaB [Phycicoccus flavus]
MGRRILAIISAAVIALVGAVLVLLYARGADARAVEAASPTTVYTTTALVPAGTTLKDAVRLGQMSKTEVAARAKPAGALETIDDTNGALVAMADIAPGQYVLNAAFGETPIGEKALQVASGKLAVSVQLNDPARVGDFVRPGSYLTIFVSYALKDIGTSEQAKAYNEADLKATSVLLDNVKVIAMGTQSLTPQQPQATEDANQDPTAQANATPQFLVTVEVDAEDAAKLIHGINNYTLYAGLRGSELTIPKDLFVADPDLLPGAVK